MKRWNFFVKQNSLDEVNWRFSEDQSCPHMLALIPSYYCNLSRWYTKGRNKIARLLQFHVDKNTFLDKEKCGIIQLSQRRRRHVMYRSRESLKVMTKDKIEITISRKLKEEYSGYLLWREIFPHISFVFSNYRIRDCGNFDGKIFHLPECPVRPLQETDAYFLGYCSGLVSR